MHALTKNAQSAQTVSRMFPPVLAQSETPQQLGLVASPTPFLNGKPFTLFRNGQLYTNGAVGVALPPRQLISPTHTIDYCGFQSTQERLTLDA